MIRAVMLAALAAVVLAVAPAHSQPEAREQRADVTRWARLVRPVVARIAPDADARALTIVRTATTEGESNLVVVHAIADGPGGRWAQIRLAILPNGSMGWVPRGAIGAIHHVRTRLVVDREEFRATLWRGGRVVFRARIGVGQTRWPTPRGEFYVREKLAGFDDPFYGPVAFGTSARSRVLTDWPGGGYIGIHGTDAPALIPGRISHGCIRMRNADVLRLAQLMPLGTAVTID